MLPDKSVNKLMEQLAEGSERKLNWSTNWVVRYVVVIKCRGVIKSKG